MDQLLDLSFLFGAGLIGGFLAGLLGIGGGPIYVIIFGAYLEETLGLDYEGLPKIIIANAVFAKLFAGIMGSIRHYMNKNFYLKTSLLIAIPAVFSSVIMSFILIKIEYPKEAFAIIFIALLLPLLFKMMISTKEKTYTFRSKRTQTLKLLGVGVASGVVTAISGLGGGFLIIPLLSSLFYLDIRKIMSISLAVIAIVSIAIVIFYITATDIVIPDSLSIGALHLKMTLPVIAGVLLSTPYGVNVSRRLSAKRLRLLFLIFCSAVIIRTLIQYLT